MNSWKQYEKNSPLDLNLDQWSLIENHFIVKDVYGSRNNLYE